MPSVSTNAQKNGQPLGPDRTPTTDFEFPADPLADSVKDWFKAKYGADLSNENAAWLGGLFTDFLSNELNLVSRARLNAEFSLAARRLLQVLIAIDSTMSEAINQSRAGASLPVRKWREVTLCLGLPSACYSGLTQAEVGRQHGLTKMGVSKAVHRLARVCGLEPAFGKGAGFQNLQQ